MKILIAPDKFKGSMSAQEVCEAIGKGLKKYDSNVETVFHPMADGGDGSLDILSSHLSLKKNIVKTVDPIGREITAHYFTSSETAFIELASASGLVLLSKKERNPLLTSTVGTGRMIADAISKGYQNIYFFLGGSATNDAGMGIATELGFSFLDKNKNELLSIGENLLKVKFIHSSPIFDFEKIKITLLCDVSNPMSGPSGAAYIYAFQKGANETQIQNLDEGLINFCEILKQQFGINPNQISGSGAAGGIGGGLHVLLNAQIEKGFNSIAQITNLEEQIKSADWVISGEGKLDSQSLNGKVIEGVARLCKKHKKPLTLFVGKNELNEQQLEKLKIHSIYSIVSKTNSSDKAMKNGFSFLKDLAFDFYHSI